MDVGVFRSFSEATSSVTPSVQRDRSASSPLLSTLSLCDAHGDALTCFRKYLPVPDFVQIEQLHLFVPRLRSMSAPNRTAPQWQLPLKVLIITPRHEVVGRKVYTLRPRPVPRDCKADLCAAPSPPLSPTELALLRDCAREIKRKSATPRRVLRPVGHFLSLGEILTTSTGRSTSGGVKMAI